MEALEQGRTAETSETSEQCGTGRNVRNVGAMWSRNMVYDTTIVQYLWRCRVDP